MILHGAGEYGYQRSDLPRVGGETILREIDLVSRFQRRRMT